ncbi:MAG: orotidine-5'-phosphate decarboxylase [Gammaproteobacteria bacterium]|nr:orotidine-5'-phosphate decarboxylase [Gammaproteobacteria bacterium]NIR82469.1 orotidine-5'-phosphate decarboxylase [Gammaproteobacteria bacterium]NIR88465.1 orotidine-5'-phosphate decarboxylase [Gammaproteobacteria bacterium]NIU03605.1 orotidine-5'-phosphate decarboxylase [Gammaproteobacteria bacterium]NIV50957.1 orotidine-5'-phosphate decarboxylase [Gammaproteobacteria bacterium]
MSTARQGPRVVVALDFPDARDALALARRLNARRCAVKVGHELFVRSGPEVVRSLRELGFRVFLDLKFHDIPNTVAAGCRAAAELGVWLVTVHAAGGRRMLAAALEGVSRTRPRPLVIAVTVLTSLGEADLAEAGFAGAPVDTALRLARLAHACGVDGVVCSPEELEALRGVLPPPFRLITPGIRPRGAALEDQRRVMSAGDAVRRGADHLVIGRPITRAADPLAALGAIEAEIREAEG